MKTCITVLLFSLLVFSCTTSSLEQSYINQDHPYTYIEFAKNRECSFNERIAYLNKAEQEGKKKKNDSVILIALSYKAFLFKEQKLQDSVIITSKKMLDYAQKSQDSNQIGRAFFKIAEYFRNKNKNDSAFYYLNESKTIFEKIGDTIEAAKKNNIMGRILADDGNYSVGENLLTTALEYAKKSKDSMTISGIYQNLSIIYRERLNYDTATKYIEKALSFSQSSKHKATLNNSKFLILQGAKKYDQVIPYYKELIDSKPILSSRQEYARVLDNLAYTKWLAGYTENIEKELNEAMAIRDSLQDSSGLIASYNHLMKYYSISDPQLADKYGKKLYQLSVEQNNISDRLDALEYLRKTSNTNNHKYALLELKLKDSLLTARKLLGSNYASLIYSSKESEKKYLEEKKEKILINQKRIYQNVVYGGTSLIILITSIFIYFFIRGRYQKEKIKAIHNTEKRLSKKLHDEVGNDVFYLMSQLINETETSPNANKNNVIQGLDAVYHKVRDFSRDNTVETGPEYEYELRSLLNSYGNDKTRIITNKLENDFWSVVSDYKKTELYWILKELLTNMKKHSEATIVSINITKEKKTIIVKYADNGKGTDLSKLSQKMNGLNNVINRIKDIKGTITFDTIPNKGFKSVIKFSL